MFVLLTNSERQKLEKSHLHKIEAWIVFLIYVSYSCNLIQRSGLPLFLCHYNVLLSGALMLDETDASSG